MDYSRKRRKAGEARVQRVRRRGLLIRRERGRQQVPHVGPGREEALILV